LAGYQDYLVGLKEGIKAAERQFSLTNVVKLRGPAGLFKDEKKHKFCWGVLQDCNKNVEKCPIDIITFHRKGDGNDAQEILNGSLNLLEEFSTKFPNLKNFKYSNTEADPIKKWSEPRDFQADTRYAAVLIETVFEHWQAIYDGRMKNLDSISHDNSFLNFYPNFFTQRTLLARFQMNNTTPKHIQFVQKPVFSALGLIANLASHAAKVNTMKDISFVITANNNSERFYACICLWSHVDIRKFSNKSKTFDIEIKNLHRNESFNDVELFYFVEGIDNKRTNPWMIFKQQKSPPFPNFQLFEEMRIAHNPMIFEQPAKVVDGKIVLNLQLTQPFVISVRICSKNVQTPKRVKNLRLKKINSEEIIIFWSDSFYHSR
jgi:L-iduronidase